MIPGNPQIVATNGKYNIIQRGKSYAILEDGKPIEHVRSWKSKRLLTSFLYKGYKKVEPSKPYEIQNPVMIIATNGDAIIVSNGSGYALIKDPDDNKGVTWRDERFLYTLLSKGGFRKIEPEEYDHKITLAKSTNANLVKKKVPVHQENGKIHMAYRWVNPLTGEVQESSNKGKNEEQLYINVSQNNVTNEEEYTDDGLELTNDELDLDDEWISGNEELEATDSEFDDSDGKVDLMDAFLLEGDLKPEEYEKEFEDIASMIEDKNNQDAIEYSGIKDFPELLDMVRNITMGKSIIEQDAKYAYSKDAPYMNMGDNFDKDTLKNRKKSMAMAYRYRAFVQSMDDNREDIVSSIEERYLNENLKKCDDMVASRKQRIHNFNKKSSQNTWGRVASHPAILKYSLINSLGKDVYDKLKSQLSKSNQLTINFPTDNFDGIEKNGYTSTSFVEAIHRSLPEYEQNNTEILKRDTKQYLDVIQSATSGDGEYNFWKADFDDVKTNGEWPDYLSKKSRIEYEVTGTHPKDVLDRPIYLSYNPTGSFFGGAPWFGDGVMRLKDHILPMCTACDEDSFYSPLGTVPVVNSVDHIEDMFISKLLYRIPDNIFGDVPLLDGSSDTWTSCSSDNSDALSLVPIELHYHGKKLENNKDFIMNGKA